MQSEDLQSLNRFAELGRRASLDLARRLLDNPAVEDVSSKSVRRGVIQWKPNYARPAAQAHQMAQ